jgi:uncharacterized protein HemX
MSVISASAVTTPPSTSRATHSARRRGTGGARWALLAALALGAVGGAGVSALLVHNQVHTRTVFVPVPSDPGSAGAGTVQRKV